MSVSPKIAKWAIDFSKSGPSGWRCPRCRAGTLRLIPNSFTSRDVSAFAEHEVDVELVFACMLACSRCRQAVGGAGRGFVEDEFIRNESGEEERTWQERFRPSAVIPSPELIEIRASYPALIRDQLKRVFVLFWVDTGACLNSLRTTVEIVLNLKSIPDGRLHDRIEKFKSVEPELGDSLMAIKWLGNEGSHADQPTRIALL